MLPLLLQNPPAGDVSPFSGILPLIPIFLIFWFMIIRPQQKQRKEEEKMRNELAEGDRIVTTAGIVAKVVRVKDSEVVIDLDGSARMTVLKSSVLQRITDGADKK
jgi:preprotein translocase subunit YajC